MICWLNFCRNDQAFAAWFTYTRGEYHWFWSGSTFSLLSCIHIPCFRWTIYTHATSYNYTTKVAPNKIVSHPISCIQANSTGQVQSSLSSSWINSRICWLSKGPGNCSLIHFYRRCVSLIWWVRQYIYSAVMFSYSMFGMNNRHSCNLMHWHWIQ